MTVSVFGAAFDKLPRETQAAISRQLHKRCVQYKLAMRNQSYPEGVRAVIIGDTPGPGRPNDPNYHHTPFYSTKNSSLWVNKLLIEADIPEEKLLWFNAVLASGEQLDPIHIQNLLSFDTKFIVLGGNAEKWFKSAAPGVAYEKVYHPQFAKRFKSKEPYALIDILKEIK